MRFTEDLKARVSKAQKKIVLPETNSRRVLKAAERVLADGFAKIVLVGKLEQIKKRIVEAEKQAEPAGERKRPITTIGSTIIKNRLNGLIK